MDNSGIANNLTSVIGLIAQIIIVLVSGLLGLFTYMKQENKRIDTERKLNKLKSEVESELDKTRHELDLANMKEQVKFAKLHIERAEAIKCIHKNVINCRKMLNDIPIEKFIKAGPFTRKAEVLNEKDWTSTITENREEFRKTVGILYESVQLNEIYLDSRTQEIAYELVNCLIEYDQDNNNYPGLGNPLSENDENSYFIEMQSNVIEIRKSILETETKLKHEFQRYLGYDKC